MRWYADNSELNGIRGASIPDILLFGGVTIQQSESKLIKETIEAVKSNYGYKRAPIKWNFKDLKKLYISQGRVDLYNNLLSSSKEWRMDIMKCVAQLDFTIIISIVESHSIAVKTLRGYKPDLTRYVFSNGLMRFALHVQEESPDRAQVILDWPDRGDSKPFDSEYVTAYNEGKTRERNVSYHSGPLEKLNFYDCPAYVNMHHSTLLQFSDLVLGATREVIECALGKKESGFGVDCCKVMAKKYRGYPDKIDGRGISVASRRSEFRSTIKQYFAKEICGE